MMREPMAHQTDTNTSQRITVDDLLNLRQVSDARIHPGGEVVAYTIGPNVSDTGKQVMPSELWLADVATGECRQLSAHGTRATHPRWSPDGSTLAFLGRRREDDVDQIFTLHLGWGEASALTDLPAGVAEFSWACDATWVLALAADEDEGADERAGSGRDWVEYEENPRLTRPWRVDSSTGDANRIGDRDLQVWEAAISPDGNRIAVLVSDAPYDWSWYHARLALIDVTSGDVETRYAPDRQMTGLSWSSDGSALTLITCTWSDQGMTGGDVLMAPTVSGDFRNLTDGHPRSYLSAVWEPNGTWLLCAAIEDGESTIGYLSIDGEWRPIWREPISILRWGGDPFTVARVESGGVLTSVISRPTAPADVHVANIEGDKLTWRRISDANPWIRQRTLPSIEARHWESTDGTRVQGLLVSPVDPPPGPSPTIVLIHGGPTSLWSYEFHGTRSMGWVQLLAAEGYIVFLPNPRGSMGFGTAVAEANVGDMGGGDLIDILSGVDDLVRSGVADPDRLGVGGWSYGGYLTPWAITQTNRFKAAVSGASITNWVSFHGVSTIPAFDSTFYRVDPFNWDGHYGQFSPMAHVRNVVTPTLFLHGEKDPICPPGQAFEMWRALKEIGIETQAVIYPREGHGPREREHLRDVLERAVAWWKRFV